MIYMYLIVLPKNLFPVQIENALTAHDSIREAAVVSVPDLKYGEVVGAWIIREPGKDVVSREDVRMAVVGSMNPQVNLCVPNFC
jgi:acyl-CoA synthetase (AMP-forming)/AMP-acid ligase II